MERKCIWGVLSVLLTLSCATSQFGWKADSKSPAKENRTSPYVEDFDANNLNDDDINPALDKAILQSFKQVRTASPAPTSGKAPEEKIVNGYRIQLLATKDENQANETKKQAILKFQEKVYLIFEAPFYRIRVGDYVDEEAAKSLRDEAVKKGFADAWIVPSKVSSRESSTSRP